MSEVKKRRRGRTRITRQHQVTIPVDAMRSSGLDAGDTVVVRADGPGRVVLTRETDLLDEIAGSLTGAYESGELEALRDEWD